MRAARQRTALPRPSRTRRGGPRPQRLFFALATLALTAFAGVFTAHRLIDPHASIGTTLTEMFHPVPAPQELFHKDRLAILLLGIDYNYDDKDQEFSAGARSDTIMALSLDLPTHSLHVLSVPRDMEYTYADGHIDKINAAFSEGGPHASERAVAGFLGIPGFDRYVVLRINATKALVDAIGGIDVPVTETLNYDDNWGHLHIHFKPGMTHMDGDQAVSYSRFRHDACSDPCRIKRQQQVLRITIAKLKNDKFNDLAHINKLIDVVNQNVQTDLLPAERLSLAAAYAGFNLANLQSDQIPYTDDRVVANGGDVLIPDQDAKSRLVQKLFLAEVPAAIASADPAVAGAIVPSHIHVEIENGSGVPGLAQHVADELQQAGFAVDHVGNAADFNHDVSEIHVTASDAALAQRIKQSFGSSVMVLSDEPADPQGREVARVVVGRDVVPAAGATP